MLKTYAHKHLIANGAPVLPEGYFYHPIVVFVDNARLLRMEIRKKSRWFSHEVARWTVNPDSYFNDSDTATESLDKINQLCINVARSCDHFVTEEA